MVFVASISAIGLLIYLITTFLIVSKIRNATFASGHELYDILDSSITSELLRYIIRQYFTRAGEGILMLGILCAVPFVNAYVCFYLVKASLPSKLELIIEYEYNDWRLDIFEAGDIIFAEVNNDHSYRAEISLEAFELLITMDDEKIKMYMELLKVCIQQAMETKDYGLLVGSAEKQITFSRVNLENGFKFKKFWAY